MCSSADYDIRFLEGRCVALPNDSEVFGEGYRLEKVFKQGRNLREVEVIRCKSSRRFLHERDDTTAGASS